MSSETQTKVDPELPRKALHVLVACLPFAMILIGRETSLAILIPSAVLAVATDVARTRFAGLESGVQRVFGFMMRPSESGATGRVVINGATWVLLSLSVLTMLFDLRLVAPVFAMFVLGDAAAGLIGARVGRHPWPWGDRTLEGSAAFVGVAAVAGSLLPGLSLPEVGVAAVAGAIAEAVPGPFDDNFRSPLAMAALVALIRLILTS